jgi:hypothetical protein
MADIFEVMRSTNEFAARFESPAYLTAAMRAFEEQERATRFFRETQPALELARLGQEQAETLRRVQELATIGRFDQFGLYGATLEATSRLLGSSIGAISALEAATERQHALVNRLSPLDAAAIERVRELERINEQSRSLQAVAESTYGLNSLLRDAAFSSTALQIASDMTAALAPYNALERACGSILEQMASVSGMLDGYPDVLKFGPVVLPNVAAKVLLATLSPSDLDQEEIEESLEALNDLVQVDRAGLVLQLSAIHPRLPTSLQTARDISKLDTPERISAVCGQLRRALDFALHTLAPEDDVRQWVTNTKVQSQPDGRPKRITRVTYIFRDLSCGHNIARMFYADCVVYNRMYSQFSSECHTGVADYDEALLNLLITRVEALLYSISCITFGNLTSENGGVQ